MFAIVVASDADLVVTPAVLLGEVPVAEATGLRRLRVRRHDWCLPGACPRTSLMIDAAAEPDHAAIAAPRRLGGGRLLLRDDQVRGLPRRRAAGRDWRSSGRAARIAARPRCSVRHAAARVRAARASRRNRSSVSARSTTRRDVTLPAWSTSSRTSTRPSSGGSSRISKRFDPSCERATISTARPAIGHRVVGAGFDPQCHQWRNGRQDRLRGEMERDHRGVVADGADRDRSRRGRRGRRVVARFGLRRRRGDGALGRMHVLRCRLDRRFGRGFARRGRLARRRMVGRRPDAGRLLAFGLAGLGRHRRLLLLRRGRLRRRCFDRGGCSRCRQGFCASCVGAGLAGSGFGVSAAFAGAASAAAGWFCVSGASVACGRSAGNAGVAALRSTGVTSVSSAAGTGSASTGVMVGTGVATGAGTSTVTVWGRDNTGFDVGFAAVFRRLLRRRLGLFRRLRVAFGHHDGGLGEDRELLGALYRHVGRDHGFARLRRDRIGGLAILGLPRAGGSRGLVGIRVVRRVRALRVIAPAPCLGPGLPSSAGRASFRLERLGRSGRSVRSATFGPLGSLRARRTRGLRGVEHGLERILRPCGGRLATGSRLTHGPQGDRIRYDFGQGNSLIRHEDTAKAASRGPSRLLDEKSFKIRCVSRATRPPHAGAARHRLQPGGKNCREPEV